MDFEFYLNDDYTDSILLRENIMDMGQSADQVSPRTELLMTVAENDCSIMVFNSADTCNDIFMSKHGDEVNLDKEEKTLDMKTINMTEIEFSHKTLDNDNIIRNNDEEKKQLIDTNVKPPTNNIENIEEDFAQILTDWQDQLNNLTQTDLDECLNMIENMPNVSKSLDEDIKADESLLRIFDEELNILEQASDKALNAKEEDKTATYKEEFQVTDNTIDNKIKLTIKRTKKEQVNQKLSVAPFSLPEEKCTSEKRKRNAQKTDGNEKGRKKTKTIIATRPKQEEQEDLCVDIETVSDRITVLEAPDAVSLLEQFEASENSNQSPNSCGKPTVKTAASCMRSNPQRPAQVGSQNNKSVKSILQTCSYDKTKKDSTTKEVLRLNEQRSAVSSSPDMANKCIGASNTLVTQTSRCIRQKDVKTNVTDNDFISNLLRIRRVIELDHDYCTSIVNRKDNKAPPSTYLRTRKNRKNRICSAKSDQNNKIDNLKSTDVEQCQENNETAILMKKEIKNINDTSVEKNKKTYQKTITLDQSQTVNNPSLVKNNKNNVNNSSNTAPGYPLIRSRMAVSILQRDLNNMQRDLNIMDKSQVAQMVPRMQQMVSVLKNPPHQTQSSAATSKPKENIVTTVNSSNDQIQNIIVQNVHSPPLREEETQKPSRKKLNLAEYRNRRDQTSNTGSSIQRTTLVYFHHASTTTEAFGDNPENPVWVERECTGITKTQTEIEEQRTKPKSIYDKAVQTYETVFNFSNGSTVDVNAEDENREEKQPDEQESQCRKRKRSSSSSRSSSNSENKMSDSTDSSSSSDVGGCRSRNTSTTDDSRRSKSISCERRRTMSRRRSSVSSNSSSSSPPYSYKSGSELSKSNSNSRSSSRYTDRSRSRSPQRYRSNSSSSSRSDFERNKWSRYRRDSNDRERYHDRYRRHSPNDYRSYRNRQRSPSYSHDSSYNHQYNKEKQKQVEERRVVYVGGLPDGVTKNELHERFRVFGPLENISLHFREKGNNYGFVTFVSKTHANNAVDHGNDDKSLPMYDINFGGRRVFCKSSYADLDDISTNSSTNRSSTRDRSFDSLLQEAQATLRKRKV